MLKEIGNQAILNCLISGYQIIKTNTGYYWNKIIENKRNYILKSIVPISSESKVLNYFTKELKKYWKVPLIKSRVIVTNQEFLEYVNKKRGDLL